MGAQYKLLVRWHHLNTASRNCDHHNQLTTAVMTTTTSGQGTAGNWKIDDDNDDDGCQYDVCLGDIAAVANLYIQSENHRNICCHQS